MFNKNNNHSDYLLFQDQDIEIVNIVIRKVVKDVFFLMISKENYKNLPSTNLRQCKWNSIGGKMINKFKISSKNLKMARISLSNRLKKAVRLYINALSCFNSHKY